MELATLHYPMCGSAVAQQHLPRTWHLHSAFLRTAHAEPGILPNSRTLHTSRRRLLQRCYAELPTPLTNDFFSYGPRSMLENQMRLADSLRQDIDTMQRQMDTEFEQAWRRASSLADHSAIAGRGTDSITSHQQGDGWRQWRREYRDEGPGTRVYYSESVTTFGPPNAALQGGLPALAAQPTSLLSLFPWLAAAVLFGTWASMTRVFAKQYHLTVYSEKRKYVLLLLWPLLALISPEFRKEWRSAMKGQRRRRGGRGAEESSGVD
jgi:hypothetical protein